MRNKTWFYRIHFPPTPILEYISPCMFINVYKKILITELEKIHFFRGKNKLTFG